MTTTVNSRSHFQMSARRHDSKALRLGLTGELHLAVADYVVTRRQQLQELSLEVRLDLTQLEFIDNTGIRALIRALDRSRRDGSRLTIGTDITNAVRRVIDLLGLRCYLWPHGD